MRIFRYISILLCILLIGFCIYQNSPHYQIIQGKIFGTYYNIKIRTNNKNNALREKVEAKLHDINKQMSVFEDDSEISRINKSAAGMEIALSENMRDVMRAADKVYRQSGGWFDPTLGRLVDMWGFGAGERREPADEEIKEAMKSVGFSRLKFSDDFQKLTKTQNETYINLSAIAKGYGVDEVAAVLEREGCHDYIVEIGGEIKARGFRSAAKEAWNIGINKPVAGSSENSMVISLSNLAVATSGNYRNFYQKDGKTFAHTISFQTGRPVLSDALSVSVFHESCMYADAYATAIMAMGVEKGLAFADKNKLKVIIFDNEFKPQLSEAAKTIFTE